MSRLTGFARRSFLIGSATIAGGIAFGAYVIGRDPENPLNDDLADGEAAFNPWVKITKDGITLIAPHADIGQGVFSSQAALIAEELDLEWGNFDVSFGRPSGAYWNQGFGAESGPFLSYDESFNATAVRSLMSSLVKVLGLQATGGSTSMPDSFLKLRVAGATARETLKQAAARQFKVPLKDISTANGKVILPDGRDVPYTDLAEAAAEIPPVRDVVLRKPEEWRLIGQDMLRLDIPPKSRGTLEYGIDLDFQGMKHAAVRLSPRRSARLSFDGSKAEAMRGVEQVLQINGGVAVVADNTWRAFKAMDAVEIQWAEAPYPAEQAQHWQALENSFTDDLLNNEWGARGDVDQASADGPLIEMTYKAAYAAHQPLEPLNAVILVEEKEVSVWTGHQLPAFVQQAVGEVTGHQTEQVNFFNQFSGGSFGHRLELEWVKAAAEIANQMRGTPIKLTYSREEDFAQDFPRQISLAKVKGVVENGQVKSLDLSIASPSVLASQGQRSGQSIPGPDTQIPAGAWSQPFAFPNFRVRAYATPGLAPVSSWRSVGAATAGFFADSAIDELLNAAGKDPLEGRLELVTWDKARGVLERAGEMSHWGSDLGPNRGRGISFVESFGVPVAQVVEVTMTATGIRMDKAFIALDVGQVIDPVNFDNIVKGGFIWGVGHAINSEITFADGKAEQTNFHAHEGLRLYQTPEIEVSAVDQGSPVKGVGEPPVPPAPSALSNAIFAATGKRLREMPFNKHMNFV